MASLLDHWVHAMREGDHDLAWSICEIQARARGGERRDDPSLPYHLRWVWDGSDLAGRDVLVRCYHGLGDTIQYLRFLPEVRRRAASVTLEIQPSLMAIPAVAHLADRVVPFDTHRPLPRAACDVEVMELSFALRARAADYPPPYLETAPTRLPSGTIGLCCRAGDWDPTRSIPPHLLGAVAGMCDCVTLDPLPSLLPVLNPQGCPFDMFQTAAIVAGLSLVITVDTMIAHLAGAMNKPVWLLLKHDPDWRWSPASGRSEWYPSMRIYAQASPGDWAGVAARLLHDIENFPGRQEDEDACRARVSAHTGFVG